MRMRPRTDRFRRRHSGTSHIRRGSRVFALVACIQLVPACGGEPQGPPLAQETYVDVMVALRRAHATTASPAEYEARRAEILRDAGVTDSLLVEWTRANAHDVALVAALWDSINQRLTAVEDSLR